MVDLEKIKEGIPDLKVINGYKKIMFDGLKHSFPGLNSKELSDAIDYSIGTRIRNSKASLDNNYTKKLEQ